MPTDRERASLGCRAWVSTRSYGRPGPCQRKQGLKFVRWAPEPLKTFAGRLCPAHRALLERGGAVLFAEPKS